MSHRIIAHRRPDKDEDHVGDKFHPTDDGARDQSRSDDRESPLVGGEGQERIGGSIDIIVAFTESKYSPVERAETSTDWWSESEWEAEENPLCEDDAHADEGEKELIEDILVIDKTAVEEAKSGRHEKDEDGRNHHPRIITRIVEIQYLGNIGRNCGGHVVRLRVQHVVVVRSIKKYE